MPKNHLTTVFWGLKNSGNFIAGIQKSVEEINGLVGIYAGDQLFTCHRNLSFLDDDRFMDAYNTQTEDAVEQAILWRTDTLVWAARNALKIEGDFVEAGCYKGTSARIICDTLNFADLDRQYYLYDLFVHDASMPHHSMPSHGDGLYQAVVNRFASVPNARVIKGAIPGSFSQGLPEKIAFMHIDMNNAQAEVATLDVLFERMVPGAVLILDDYGWQYYREQKVAEDAFFAARGYHVMELPTGQGMVIKQ
jgi:O-methyltransferase